MKRIGSNKTRFAQGGNIFVVASVIVFGIIFFLNSGNTTWLYLSFFGLLIGGVAMYLYLKIYEVTVADDVIIIRNILSKKIRKIDSFIKVERTVLSPFVFQLVFDDESTYRFAMDREDLPKSDHTKEWYVDELTRSVKEY